jgi:hypothetical protein
VRALPAGFAAVMRRRLERGFATHPNRTNPLRLGSAPGLRAPGGGCSGERPFESEPPIPYRRLR